MNTAQHTALAPQTSEVERNAYNLAFRELGLDWFWDAQTYASLRQTAQQRCHVRSYIETRSPHLLRAYDAEFLVNAIETQRNRIALTSLN